jgi:hypothetical protein
MYSMNMNTTTTQGVIEVIGFAARYYVITAGRIARAYLPRRAS